MQSFRERSGFHGNQHCYQQDSHEFSHLESYRPPHHNPHHHHHHLGQSRQAYETHPLSSTGMPPSRPPSTKDCYGQQGYPTYIGAGSNSSTAAPAPAKKPSYHEGKVSSSQHLQAGYGNHMGGPGGYSTQYLSEGHLQQQKWEDTAPQLGSYEQDMVGRLEPGGGGGGGGGGSGGGASQYLEQGMLGKSQSLWDLPGQASAPVYTSPHQQSSAQSPLMYPQSHLHFPPQHSQLPPHPPSSSTSPYMDKCAPMPHAYKGYSMPPGPQYSRQLGNHSGLKPSSYRPQNSYSYQPPPPPPPPSRSGFEQQQQQQQQPVTLQGMAGSQESMSKFQHYQHGQGSQQGYCMPDIPVRSPEQQYYQNCSPSSSHSPARSVGRSPSYSSTPSPLMPNPEASFQYSQPPTPINPAAASVAAAAASSSSSSSSSSSGALQDQGMLMPPHTHASPAVNHQTQSYSGGTMKERFSEKLLSNPSLWSLNALTSQVESISNNVQQLLLSEALMANKKGGKRGTPKKGEEYRGQMRGLDDSCPDGQQHGTHMSDPYGTPKSLTAELHEGAYSGSTEEQLDRSYYYCSQSRGPLHGPSNPHMPLNAVSSCSMTLLESRSVNSFSSMQTTESNPHLGPRLQSITPMEGDHHNSSLQHMTGERSPISIPTQSPMKQETHSPPDIKRVDGSLKENFEECAWMEKTADEEEQMKNKLSSEQKFKGEVIEAGEKQERWSEDEKSPSLFPKMCTDTSGQSDAYESEGSLYQEVHNKSDPDDSDSASKRSCGLLGESHQGNLESEMKSETFKSEPSPTAETHPKALPSISRGDLAEDQYLPSREENSETLHLSPCSKQNEATLLTAEGRKEVTLEGQPSVLACQTTEVREEQRSQSPSDEVVNNTGRPQEPLVNYSIRDEQQECQTAISRMEAEEAVAAIPDAPPQNGERRPAVCDIAPQCHTSQPAFAALGEKATPLAQTRDHIDHSDAKVLEPDSPQLPGKSILHSAPSWANTPPSPQKGDEDMEPGISCPSAVTPSAKPEPMAPSANPRAFGRKPGRGRRRLMHANIGIRRQLSVEGEGAPTPAQKPSIPSSKSALLSDHMAVSHEDIGSQTSKHLAESLPSRMCTRSFSAQGTPKPAVTPVSPPLKKKPGPKPGGGSATKGQVGRPRGLASKLKLLKQVEEIQASIDQARAKRAVSGLGTQEENPDPITLETATEMKSTSLKDQKAMVLRSRKQTPEKTEKEPVKEKETLIVPPKKVREMKKQKAPLEQVSEASDSIPPTTPHKEICLAEPSKQQEKIAAPVKRQSTLQSPEAAKRKRGVKADKAEVAEPLPSSQSPVPAQEQHDPTPPPSNKTGVGVRGPKKKRGPHPKIAVISSPVTKDEAPAVPDVSEVPSAPPQCPTKTKYLPPRKGRGLKYEAMVQKITSTPASKKQPFNLLPEALPEDPASKAVQPVPEQKEELPEESSTAVQQPREETQEPAADGQTPRKKRRKWATVESKVEPEGALDAGTLIITTPRLAKQRAIKNNHEMHLKQRRKRRKGQAVSLKESEIETQLHVEPLTEPQELPAPSALTPTAAPVLVTSSDQPPTEPPPEAAVEPPKPRRGRKPSLKKKEAKASGEPNSVPAKRGRKPGPKKKAELSTPAAKPPPSKPPAKSAAKATETVPKPKTRCRKQSAPKVKQTKQETRFNVVSTTTPLKPEIKCSFIPYVRIESSVDLAAACAIVNRPDDAQRIKAREKIAADTKPPAAAVAKAIPTSSLMLLGPLVNKTLADRCLKCCLCGMPSNYRDLGDLCGPYYLPNNIPQKTVSWGYREEFWENRERAQFRSTQPPTVQESEKTSEPSQAGTSEEHPGHHRKPRRPSRESSHPRTNFRLGLKKLQQCLSLRRRTAETAPPSGEEGLDTALGKAQRKAEEREHWAHEACVVWTSGVVLVAGRLYGLKEAVQSAAQTKCAKCQSEGASVSCSCEGCSHKYHYVCAKESGCLFEDGDFSVRCPKHEVSKQRQKK
ncbi:retinoic acid-induced protein 1 [Alosa pseudoharengus]|uniref:retinoic acid-induced protein 1 n=1 Tax=Alosa pseudoharengus TaxID=34774 RepID=UPI003F88FCAA